VADTPESLYRLKRTPLHARTSELCLPQNWRRWAGYIAVGSYDLGLDREYWAIRDAAALIDISPLMKYLIEGPDAAALLHRMTPRDIHKMAVGQVYYTGWCDDEGRMLDDGTITRLAEQSFRLTSAEPSLRWLAMNAVGLQVTISEQTDRMAALSLQGPKSRAVLNGCCEQSVDGLPAACVTEVDCGDVRHALLQARDGGFDLAALLVRDLSLARNAAHRLVGLISDGLVIRIARRAEHLPHLLVVQAFDEPRLDQRGVSAAFDDLAQDPVQVLLRLLAAGQRIHRVLDGDCAELLQPPPDLHAKVIRLRWDLVDEQQPATLCFFPHARGL